MRRQPPICSLLTMLALAAAVTACRKQDAPAKTSPPAPTSGPTAKLEPVALPAATSPGGTQSAFDEFAKKCALPVARAPLVAVAPTVDGVMDDAYKQATPMPFKFLSGQSGVPNGATTAHAVCTADTLFVFFQCAAPNTPKLVANVTAHDGDVWNDESVELFLDPTNRRVDPIMHILVNPRGTVCEGKDTAGNMDAAWDPKLAVKTVVSKDAWTCELAIPFVELGLKRGEMPRVWAANFNRMARLTGSTEDIAWSPTGSSTSHVPARFGCLWVEAGTVDNTKDAKDAGTSKPTTAK